jgi:hypothetical protein
MRYVEHVAQMGQKRNAHHVLVGKPTGDHLEDLGLDMKVEVNRICCKQIEMAWSGFMWLALINTVNNLPIP